MSAPETAAELTQRLAAAVREVEATEARLAAARIQVRDLEQALATARAREAAPPPPPPAAPVAQAAPAAPAPAEAAPADTDADAAPAADGEVVDNTPGQTEAERRAPRPLTEAEQIIDGQRRALVKRGFRRDDLYYHQCKECGEHAVESYTLAGKPGGRDIHLCLACGKSWSWRRRPEYEDRQLDDTWDLATFLR